jgi:restriction system protein
MPKYHDVFADVLRVLADGKPWKRKRCLEVAFNSLDITDEEREEKLSGGGNRAMSRLGWAAESLFQAGAISHPERGMWQIADLGTQWLRDYPDAIPKEVVLQSEGVVAWWGRSKNGDDTDTTAGSKNIEPSEIEVNPEEQVDTGIRVLTSDVTGKLLHRLRGNTPIFFEKAVLKLLAAMKYGDTEHLGRPGDGGVDGVVYLDELGADQIYVQAKRYKDGSNIPAKDILAFNSAVQNFKAQRGIFITTSKFTKDALAAIDKSHTNIIPIDGDKLVELMLKYRVGVTLKQQYEVFEEDEYFFTED